jgi:hypothetical protein
MGSENNNDFDLNDDRIIEDDFIVPLEEPRAPLIEKKPQPII